MVQLPLAFLTFRWNIKIKPLLFVLNILFLLPLKCELTNAMAYIMVAGIEGESICRRIKQFVGETTFRDSSTLFTPAFSVTCTAAIFRHHSTIIFQHHLSTCCLKPIHAVVCFMSLLCKRHKFKRSRLWAVICGFRSVSFAKLVER